MGFISSKNKSAITAGSGGGYLNPSKIQSGGSVRFALLEDQPLEFFECWGESSEGGVKPFRIYADDRSNLWLKMNPKLVDIYGAEAAYEQFSKTFHEGVDAFIKGDWPTAQQKLEGAHDFCPKDTPTMLLMKEMKKRSIDQNTPTAPIDWKGYHDSDI